MSRVPNNGQLEAEVFDAAALPLEHRVGWTHLLQSRPSLDMPCFHPDFVCGLAEHVPDCKVAVLRRGPAVVGYVGFAQSSRAVAQPIPMCDYQPLVLSDDTAIDGREIALALGVRTIFFENAVTPSAITIAATKVVSAHSL